MWWGGFSEEVINTLNAAQLVLIPMWWGGFSEKVTINESAAPAES